MSIRIDGDVAGGFEHVREAFESGATDLGQGGGAFCAYVDGQKVIDLWGGERSPGTPWERETRAVLMSSTKGAAALGMLLLADRGELDPERPVVYYWPEFGAERKDGIRVAELLDHSAGVVTLLEYANLLQWSGEGWGDVEEITRRLERTGPLWEPGTQHGYHALTCGWLWGELVRRLTGSSLGEFFRKEIALPLGLELEIGTSPDTPVAHITGFDLDALPPDTRELVEPLMVSARDPDTVAGQAFMARDGVGVLDTLAELMNNPT